MNDLKTSIAKCKKRFKELEHKEWDWSAFYNGWLECFGSQIGQNINHDLTAQNKKLREALNDATAHCNRYAERLTVLGEEDVTWYAKEKEE